MATHIGPQIKVAGRVVGDDDLFVEGTIDGTVEVNGSLVIAPGGVVRGDVKVTSVRIEGRFEGRLVADHIHLTGSARVDAESLNAGLLQIEDGAKVRADIAMEIEKSQKAVPTRAPATVAAARPSVAKTPVQHTTAPKASAKPVEKAAAQSTQSTQSTTVTVVEEVVVDMSEYDSMTVKELRDRLKALELPISGTKPELAERLAEAES